MKKIIYKIISWILMIIFGSGTGFLIAELIFCVLAKELFNSVIAVAATIIGGLAILIENIIINRLIEIEINEIWEEVKEVLEKSHQKNLKGEVNPITPLPVKNRRGQCSKKMSTQ